MTFASLFSGGGGADWGAKQAGFEPAWGIEIDPQIAEIGNTNLGGHIRVQDVLTANPFDFPKVDLLHASPECKRYSNANVGATESPFDLACADKICEFIKILQPKFFTLENVRKYQKSQAYAKILQTLVELKYKTDAQILNSADFGVAQTRQRLYLQASRVSDVPVLPEKEAWVGWYAVIEDLIPALPETKFANWQLKRMPEVLAESFLIGGSNTSNSSFDPKWGRNGKWHSKARTKELPAFSIAASSSLSQTRAFIISDQSGSAGKGLQIRTEDEPITTIRANEKGRALQRAFLFDSAHSGRNATVRNQDDPSFSIQAWHGRRPSQMPFSWLELGKVVSMTPRCLARFQSFPDSYVLPEKNSLACKIIGNAVCPLMYEKIARQLLVCR